MCLPEGISGAEEGFKAQQSTESSSVSKIKEFLSEYEIGDRVKVSDIRKKTETTSLTRILWVLKRDGFIDYETLGRGRVSSY